MKGHHIWAKKKSIDSNDKIEKIIVAGKILKNVEKGVIAIIQAHEC